MLCSSRWSPPSLLFLLVARLVPPRPLAGLGVEPVVEQQLVPVLEVPRREKNHALHHGAGVDRAEESWGLEVTVGEKTLVLGAGRRREIDLGNGGGKRGGIGALAFATIEIEKGTPCLMALTISCITLGSTPFGEWLAKCAFASELSLTDLPEAKRSEEIVGS